MSRVEARAPGKLLLVGEYAVLDGASALVMAVDRRVRVSVAAGARGGCLDAPQLGIRRAAMRIERGAMCCPDQPQAGLGLTARMVPAILRELGHEPERVRDLDLEIDSGELFESGPDGPVKLGLGSSAAVSAALALALEAWFGPRRAAFEGPVLLRRWLPVYRAAMEGTASGADLAAAFLGGLSEFRISGDQVDFAGVKWPAGLHWRAVWVGNVARTTDYVGAYERWQRAQPGAARDFGRRLGRVAQQAVAGATDPVALIEACSEYAGLLGALGDAMGMQIMSEPHRRLARAASGCGVVYKSCGAGGGDLGIALATDPDRLQAFVTRVSECGGVPLNCAVSSTGAGIVFDRHPGAGEYQ